MLLLLIVLMLFLPTLASTPLGRPLVVAYVNGQLNGHVEIKNCSLGWMSGIHVDGVVIFDAADRQILQASRLDTDLTLISALRGRDDFGRVRAHGLDLLISQQPDGSLNWDHLVRLDSAWRPLATLPAITAVVQIEDGSLTFEDRSDAARLPVFLRSIHAGVKLPPSGGVYEVLSANAQLGSGKAGTILLKGSIETDPRAGLIFAQNLMVRGMDVEAVSRELGPGWVLTGQNGNSATFERNTAKPSRKVAASRPSTQPR